MGKKKEGPGSVIGMWVRVTQDPALSIGNLLLPPTGLRYTDKKKGRAGG
jgi:hypothetical protein